VTAAPPRLARAVRVRPSDDVAVAVDPLEPADVITVGDDSVKIRVPIPAGHKIALRALAAGDVVHKYGWAIGRLTAAVQPGDWIHSHNLKTQLEGTLDYTYEPTPRASALPATRTWEGF
jgi:altronate hydrolase